MLCGTAIGARVGLLRDINPARLWIRSSDCGGDVAPVLYVNAQKARVEPKATLEPQIQQRARNAKDALISDTCVNVGWTLVLQCAKS